MRDNRVRVTSVAGGGCRSDAWFLRRTNRHRGRDTSFCCRWLTTCSPEPQERDGRVGLCPRAWSRPDERKKGKVAERPNAAVLKTAEGVSPPGVRIPPFPPIRHICPWDAPFHGHWSFQGAGRCAISQDSSSRRRRSSAAEGVHSSGVSSYSQGYMALSS